MQFHKHLLQRLYQSKNHVSSLLPKNLWTLDYLANLIFYLHFDEDSVELHWSQFFYLKKM